jgi:hypothetical protein
MGKGLKPSNALMNESFFVTKTQNKVAMDDGSGGRRNQTNDLTRKLMASKSDDMDGEAAKYIAQKEHANPVPDRVRSQKLNSMTPEERMHGLYDLHCVSGNISETQDYVVKKLSELEFELSQSIKNTHIRSAYDNIKQNDLKYTSEMRIQFLRADRFNVAKAAARMMRHFHLKQDFFGSDSLGRDLVLDDLSAADWEYINSGCIQVLSQRDQKGRAVIILLGRLCVESSQSVQTTVSSNAGNEGRLEERSTGLPCWRVCF